MNPNPARFWEDQLPTQNTVKLTGQTALATALMFDKFNQKFLCGGTDGVINFWDFQSMDDSLKPFRSIEPFEQ